MAISINQLGVAVREPDTVWCVRCGRHLAYPPSNKCPGCIEDTRPKAPPSRIGERGEPIEEIDPL